MSPRLLPLRRVREARDIRQRVVLLRLAASGGAARIEVGDDGGTTR